MPAYKMRPKYKALLDQVPTDKHGIAEQLLKELEFLEDTLEALKDEVRKSGVVENFQQGKQNFMRESPALKLYNQTVQRYSTMYRQVSDMIGKSADSDVVNPVLDFIRGA